MSTSTILKQTLCGALLGLLSFSTQAQVTTDPTRATAARDSVLLLGNIIRLGVESQAQTFTTNAPRQGVRRQVVKGYYLNPVGAKQEAWKLKTLTFRNGTVREKYRAKDTAGRLTLTETRIDGHVVYLDARQYRPRTYTVGAPLAHSGMLTRSGYVRWGTTLYAVPAKARL